MHKLFVPTIILTMVLTACGASQGQVETAIAQTALAQITNTPAATKTPEPSNTPEPTNTPKPTNTPRPTATAVPPTATATAIPPVTLTGRGDSVVDIEPVAGVARLARITYTGGGNFAIWNYDSNNDKIDLLVNHIGAYKGTVPIDLDNDNPTARFEVTASGEWTIEVVALREVRRESAPGFEGEGDDVVFLDGEFDTIAVDGTRADGNFAIWAYGDSRDLLVNEIAPYSGVVIIPKGTLLLVIQTEGPWAIGLG